MMVPNENFAVDGPMRRRKEPYREIVAETSSDSVSYTISKMDVMMAHRETLRVSTVRSQCLALVGRAITIEYNCRGSIA